jgi:hypothetical protein
MHNQLELGQTKLKRAKIKKPCEGLAMSGPKPAARELVRERLASFVSIGINRLGVGIHCSIN